MDRKDILKSPDYWTSHIQMELYQCAEKFMQENGLNRSQLAEKLGVSKGYVSQLLNGDYDHRLSKMVELSLAFGYVPKIDFIKIDKYVYSQKIKPSINIMTLVNAEYKKEEVKINIPIIQWDNTKNYRKEAV